MSESPDLQPAASSLQPARTETLTFRPRRQQRTETLALRRAHDDRMDRAARRRHQLAQRHPATVARRLALAHRIAEEIDAGRYADQADVARHHGLTRARLTPRMNLLLLAPDIQEEVLTLEYPAAGREPIIERTLRRLLESLVWEDQRALWAELRAVAGVGAPRPRPAGSALVCSNRLSPAVE